MIGLGLGPSDGDRVVAVDIRDGDVSSAELSSELEDPLQVFRLPPALGEESAQQEGPVDGVQPRHVRRHHETRDVKSCSGSNSSSRPQKSEISGLIFALLRLR